MKRTTEQVIGEIEKFLSGTGGAYDWDDFTTLRIDDPELEAVRNLCGDLPDLYPPSSCRQYCGEEGLIRLRQILSELRSHAK